MKPQANAIGSSARLITFLTKLKLPRDLLCAAVTGGLAFSAGADTLWVTTTDDVGDGSLRQAIAMAAPGDTIAFQTNGTIVLTNGELVLGWDLNIVGPGPKLLTLDGNHFNRVFNILAGVTASISELTISNGLAAGENGVYYPPRTCCG